MRKWMRIGSVFVVALFFGTSLAMAAPWKGSGGWGMGSPYQRNFNVSTVESVSGTVVSVEQTKPMKGMYYGMHIIVKTEKESLEVHLGPGWYIERLDTRIEKGDKVEVKGSRVTMAGKQVIIAQEVKKGDNTLILRDSAGVPAWAGWRR
ncbi:MAG: DNA-binding protein [Nitrospirae bacterium]|nr:DNA-binding protein [Nitrospirota bacterium]